jgi:FKBP-type peptidyl-prolyl cis-trans isomerase FkpA
MQRFIIVVLATLLAVPAFAADLPKTEDQKTLYAIGLSLSRQLSVFTLTPAESEFVRQGFKDGSLGNKTELDLNDYSEKIQQLAMARRKASGEKLAPANKAFLDKAAQEKGAQKTESGMVFLSLNEGSGAAPGLSDTVKVNFRGMHSDGTEFANSYTNGKPAEVRVDGTILCWKEGLQKIKVGGKAKLVCPSSLAYGDTGAGEVILPGAALAFEVELLEIKK